MSAPVCERKPLVLASTDLGGVAGNVELAVSMYCHALQQLGIPHGLEVIAFYKSLEYLQQNAANIPSTFALHGRIGATPGEPLNKQLEGFFFNTIIASTPELVPLATKLGAEYVLVHQNELLNPQAWQACLNAPADLRLFIENHPSLGSYERSLATAATFRDHGQNAAVMVDLLHLLKEHPEYQQHLPPRDFRAIWWWMLQQISYGLDEGLVRGFHLPIGTTDDAVPRNIVFKDPGFWKDFAKLINSYDDRVDFLVIENQQHLAKLRLPSALHNQVRRTNCQLLEFMVKCDVLPTSR